MGKVKWLDDKFVNALDSKMTLLLALWVLDKVVMTTLFFVFR
jgi:hypothetical protein